ncbi:MAG TPA: chromate transporter [Candidatus Limiplasma sp.]|nr:chromate transporter [Candidatus Limiplasma sp.]HPR77370.1 chromate transporter [Candidatus Limiplasma sp.]
MKELFDLFLSFSLIGTFTFGGGFAMLPMLTREIVDKHHWATDEELLDYFAIGQCTPGVIAVNTATFIGYRRHGALGAAIATLGVVLPSFFIIVLIAAFLSNFMQIVWISHAFAGIRIAVCALIVSTVLKLFKTNATTLPKVLIAVLAFVCVALLSLSPIYVTLAFLVFGAFFFGRGRSA